MLNLLFATLLSLPLYPLNPTAQDTVSTYNLHATFGVNGPTSFLSAGPEITAKYEYRIYHPFLIRTSLDYRYGTITSNQFPDGSLNRYIVSGEAIYYRGTDFLTGYFGVGLLYSMYNFNPTDDALEFYNEVYGADDIRVKPTFGYRFIAGLRWHRHFSIEIGITEIRPKIIYYKDISPTEFQETTQKFRFNDFKISLGYLFEL